VTACRTMVAFLVALLVPAVLGAVTAAADSPVQIPGASLTPGFDEGISD
jgi:signal peptidase I